MGFIRARTITAGTSDTALFGTRAVSGNASRQAFPLSGTINEGTITVPTAPGGGNSYEVQVRDNTGSVQGSSVTLSGASQSVRSAMGASLPLYDSGTPNNAVRYLHRNDSGSPPSQDLRVLLDYTLSGVDAKRCFVGIGDSSQAFTTTTTDKFQSFDNNGNDVSTVEADHQCVWPSAGFFGPFLFTWTLTGVTGTTEIALRINGVDAFVQSFPGQATTATQVTFVGSSIAVSPGDLVNIRIKRTGSADGSMTVALVMAFSTTA